jgi:hypothetical protein
VRSLVEERVGTDTDELNHALASGHSKLQVFTNFEDAKVLAPVDSTHIDAARFNRVDQLDQD